MRRLILYILLLLFVISMIGIFYSQVTYQRAKDAEKLQLMRQTQEALQEVQSALKWEDDGWKMDGPNKAVIIPKRALDSVIANQQRMLDTIEKQGQK